MYNVEQYNEFSDLPYGVTCDISTARQQTSSRRSRNVNSGKGCNGNVNSNINNNNNIGGSGNRNGNWNINSDYNYNYNGDTRNDDGASNGNTNNMNNDDGNIADGIGCNRHGIGHGKDGNSAGGVERCQIVRKVKCPSPNNRNRNAYT